MQTGGFRAAFFMPVARDPPTPFIRPQNSQQIGMTKPETVHNLKNNVAPPTRQKIIEAESTFAKNWL